MPAQVIVLYPRKDGSTFNKDYYMSTHMPLVEKYWKKHGLNSYTVTELDAGGPYSYSCIIQFERPESFGAAVADPNTKEIMDDIDNFSSEKALLMHGGMIRQKQM